MTEAPAPAGADTLVAAVREGDASAVRTLLAADPSLAGARDPTGVSVVVLSHYHGHAELGELLASGRDDLDLFEAATVGRVESLEAVLATDPARVATLSPDGFTALHLAAFLGRVAAVERLLAAGAPVDTRSANAMSVTPSTARPPAATSRS